MKAKVETVLTFALLLALLTVSPKVFAQDTIEGDVAGVKTGDWAKYKVTRLGSSRAWHPAMMEAVWVKVEVLNVSGTTVTIRETIHDADGSEWVRNSSRDLQSGTMFSYIIAANLGPGDKIGRTPVYVNNETEYVDVTLNDTDYRSYGGVTREVNQLKYSRLWEDDFLPGHFINGTLERYWDKYTGFLLEWKIQKYVIGYEKYPSTFKLEIEDTNMWEMQKPQQSFLWLLAIPTGAIIVAAVTIKLRNNRKKNEADKQ